MPKPTFAINVTQEDIDKANETSHWDPICEAIKEQLGANKISVSFDEIRFSAEVRFTFPTPKVVREAILHFDQGHPFQPFSFTLPAEQEDNS